MFIRTLYALSLSIKSFPISSLGQLKRKQTASRVVGVDKLQQLRINRILTTYRKDSVESPVASWALCQLTHPHWHTDPHDNLVCWDQISARSCSRATKLIRPGAVVGAPRPGSREPRDCCAAHGWLAFCSAVYRLYLVSQFHFYPGNIF